MSVWPLLSVAVRKRRCDKAFETTYAGPDRLWQHCQDLAADLPGDRVVAALLRASTKVFYAGIDDAYQTLEQTSPVVAAFDAGWLTVFAIELAEEAEEG